ncbi:MAG: hypothetical protein U0793_34320 [Gemmataceae bacterium]
MTQRLWLCLPPIALGGLDIALTLLGQPSEYWAGDYRLAEELNPLARPLLTWHPFAFLGLGVLWLVSVALGILVLPRFSARLACFGFASSHAIGAATWLWRLGLSGVILSLALFVIAERLVDLAWKRDLAAASAA